MFIETTALKKILKMKSRTRIVQGGSSAGKTISILQILIDIAQSNKNKIISVVSETYPHLRKGAIKDFLLIMEEHHYFKDSLWNKTESTYTFETGSKIEFFSADQPGKVRGPRRDVLFLNEGNNISYDTYTQLAIRTNDFIYIDYNPTTSFWVHEEVIPNEKHDFVIVTYKDNEGLSESIIEALESRKGNKNFWSVYGLGQIGEVEGRIYTDWQIIDEIPHEARLERYGLDFGYTNDPTAIVAIYRYNGGFIFDEILYRKGMLNKPIADFMLNQKQALIVADSTEPKSITELNMYGLQVVGAKKGKDSNKFGIATVQQQRCSITKRSVNGIKEYRGYMWQTDANGKFLQEPEDGNDHCFIGDTLITTNTGLIPISDIKEGCFVLTKNGYRRVRKKWNNGLRLVNRYSLQFDTFSVELICTPDHKVKTGSTWTQISKLKSGQMVTLSNSLTGKDTSSILKRDIFLNTLQECMLQFGSFLTDLYQKVSRYIIKTETPGITPFQTSRSFLDRNTYQCMQGVGFRKTKNGLSIFKSRGSKKLLSGTNPTMEDSGTRYTAKRVGLKENQENSSVNGVALSTKQSTRGSLFTATKTVELKRLDVKESSRQIVYDLTVEQSHEYFANGILVHNCMDAIKYGVKNIIPDDIIPIKQFSGQAILNQLLEEQY